MKVILGKKVGRWNKFKLVFQIILIPIHEPAAIVLQEGLPTYLLFC